LFDPSGLWVVAATRWKTENVQGEEGKVKFRLTATDFCGVIITLVYESES
jgi:hypothetical protein